MPPVYNGHTKYVELKDIKPGQVFVTNSRIYKKILRIDLGENTVTYRVIWVPPLWKKGVIDTIATVKYQTFVKSSTKKS